MFNVLVLAFLVFNIDYANPENSNFIESLTKKSNWEVLIRENYSDIWHEYNSKKPANWIVKDGILYTLGGNGDIVTNKEYGNFELEVEWKIEKGGNSGIFYYVVEGEQYKSMWETGPEFQIIDERNYSIDLLEKQKTGACSDVLPPTKLASNFPGEWNYTRIVAKNGNIEHWLNGKLVLSYSMDSDEWKNAVQESKFSKLNYAKIRKGKIGLQDHGDPVYFRKIRIREL
ncbi:MAG: Uncharacterized protein XD92_0360 [Proteiniphilum acetatigenes]|uniref:3-keto-alpha-glucoside-1,2-lyase/3-keto-2-hydroxy-glucal hydratase domain-containing protein n=1 Tax=Proteiniphilum acetatigenes TaxID=294710 RepID=A0A124FXK8_9BACT|nr:MAG: Uncharacterized protein XD92_0360 [Proteiniphilum acetatigenes]